MDKKTRRASLIAGLLFFIGGLITWTVTAPLEVTSIREVINVMGGVAYGYGGGVLAIPLYSLLRGKFSRKEVKEND